MGKHLSARGFTATQFVIATAVIAILAVVMVLVYQNYLTSSGMAEVRSRYEEATRFVADAMREDRARVADGYAGALPGDTAAWAALLNGPGALAPGGGPAYKSGSLSAVDEASGVIGLVAANGGRTVTLTRPAYQDFSRPVARTIEYDLQAP